ncbi:MAG: M28 family peptidase [Bacteroidetes bacterium]|nr:M28 family peptidase [Bacteroidota bacterium]
MRRLSYILLFSLTFFSICIFPQDVSKIITELNIKINLEVLASDLFEGREATTRGEKLAQLYIISQLKKAGVKPFFENGSYLQKFDVNVSKTDTNSNFTFKVDDKEVKFKFTDEFFFRRGTNVEKLNSSHKLIFVGYGITAPEFNYDNYKDVDVNGKFVLILNGEPESDREDFFNGKQSSNYYKILEKIKNAKKHGAVGALLLADKQLLSFWPRLIGYLKRPNFSLPSKGQVDKQNFISAYLNKDSFKKLLTTQNIDFDKLLEEIKEDNETETVEFDGVLKFNYNKSKEVRQSSNIVGIIEGNDPILKNEYVAIGAHYDHLGVIDDKVYNGADDNGSGTVTVMEVAKTLARTKANKRSVLIVFHAGEEKGLLGSRYLTDNLQLIKDKKIVAQINLDMVGRMATDSIYSIGSEKLSSELKKIVEDVNSKTVKFHLDYKYDDPNDPNRFYYRSDHYSYAKHGIPIVFFFDDMRKDYHKDTDEVYKINFKKLKKLSWLVYGITLRIANLDHRLIVDKPVPKG